MTELIDHLESVKRAIVTSALSRSRRSACIRFESFAALHVNISPMAAIQGKADTRLGFLGNLMLNGRDHTKRSFGSPNFQVPDRQLTARSGRWLFPDATGGYRHDIDTPSTSP